MSDFEQMVSAHHAEIFQYLYRATGNRAEADDLSQETFLHAYRAASTLSAESSTRAWLFAIATNLSRKHFRSQGRRRRAYDGVAARSSEVASGNPEGEVAGKELGAAIEAAVARLPFKQRAAFLQRKIHGLDYEAIGQALDCSAESARAHVFQAVRKIRAALNGELPSDEKESS